jgi:hypothetical protein
MVLVNSKRDATPMVVGKRSGWGMKSEIKIKSARGKRREITGQNQ